MNSTDLYYEKFESRHNGPDASQVADMLKVVKASSLDQLIDETIPGNIRLKSPLNLSKGLTEADFLRTFKAIAKKNNIWRSFIGTGYYNTVTPPVLLRNILENPGWYTAYTPYQAEIAQGRLEALVNFQTMVMDLTAMPVANASLLDEATAAAEAMNLMFNARSATKKEARKFLVDRWIFPQTLSVLHARSAPMGIELVITDLAGIRSFDADTFGAFLQYPNGDGLCADATTFIDLAHANGVLVGVATDLLALTLLKPPGEMGADVVVGSSQRFGVPMGYGGPHAAFFATREEYKRQIPGRIIGVSVDARGNLAYRMALQTREQHIRRERATSNICTAQVLLAVIAGMYAAYHGPVNLKGIATRVHSLTRRLAEGLAALGIEQLNAVYFDTLKIRTDTSAVKKEAIRRELNFRYFDKEHVGISLDEATTEADVSDILEVFKTAIGKKAELKIIPDKKSAIPDTLMRTSTYLTHPVFNTHHSEHEMLRYLKKLENKDLSMVHSMIPLGSCTMKLNATAEMMPITWSGFANIHPFVPADQAVGYIEMLKKLEGWLCTITGFAAASFQPNSGAQGEFAGLMVIRAYHNSRGEHHRNVALIPASAHGTNPASAVMAGMNVVVVKSDEEGRIDTADLNEKAALHKDNLCCLMVTYPSTHGVFEDEIIGICEAIHAHGGLVYMDGANMNAQVGLTSPAMIGADVCHLNLHKTFCIPHGGGGPGMGPICVNEKLKPFLPAHPFNGDNKSSIPAIAAAPYGSALITAISYAYIAMMGGEGLTKATQLAILNANYLKDRLAPYYSTLYAGRNNRCAHEFIIDCRPFKRIGVEVEDIAKRLMDYGFHAPTVSFPVPGTLMIEPTESEAREELDKFCDAMIEIRNEIAEIESGVADKTDNVLKNAPHTAAVVCADDWNHSYSREKAAFPLPYIRLAKFWPSVSRIDNAYGDRNLVCSCPSVETYA